jgi:hypothetical protein
MDKQHLPMEVNLIWGERMEIIVNSGQKRGWPLPGPACSCQSSVDRKPRALLNGFNLF